MKKGSSIKPINDDKVSVGRGQLFCDNSKKNVTKGEGV